VESIHLPCFSPSQPSLSALLLWLEERIPSVSR
jgi:hypothetical protein